MLAGLAMRSGSIDAGSHVPVKPRVFTCVPRSGDRAEQAARKMGHLNLHRCALAIEVDATIARTDVPKCVRCAPPLSLAVLQFLTAGDVPADTKPRTQ